MKTNVITFVVKVQYSYDEKDIPNLSFLTMRKLRENLEGSLEFVRQTDSLDHGEVIADWVEVR